MSRLRTLAPAVAIALTFLFASCVPSSYGEKDAKKALFALHQEMRAALAQKNVTWFVRHFADDVQVNDHDALRDALFTRVNSFREIALSESDVEPAYTGVTFTPHESTNVATITFQNNVKSGRYYIVNLVHVPVRGKEDARVWRVRTIIYRDFTEDIIEYIP